MNITPSLIYWATRMDAINGVLFTLLVLATVGVLACLAIGLGAATARKSYSESDAYIQELHTSGEWLLRKIYIPVAVWCLVGIALILTPTTKELAAMYVIPAVANNEKVSDAGNKLYELAVEWMEELRPQKGEK